MQEKGSGVVTPRTYTKLFDRTITELRPHRDLLDAESDGNLMVIDTQWDEDEYGGLQDWYGNEILLDEDER